MTKTIKLLKDKENQYVFIGKNHSPNQAMARRVGWMNVRARGDRQAEWNG